MGKSKFTFTGGKELKANLKRLETEYPEAADLALYEEAEGMMTLAKVKCPVDTGRLMNTGYVHPPSESEVEMGFGTDYAMAVHERTDANFVTGEAKFLENAINERTAGFEERMAKRIKARVGL